MIKLKTAFILLFGSVISLLIIIILAFYALFLNRQRFDESLLSQHNTFKVSDKLRERNDDLTHCCLNYIVTSDTSWRNRYYKIEQDSKFRIPTKEKGFIIMKDSLKNLGFGNLEYEILKQAVELTNILNTKEAKAIDLIYSSPNSKENKTQALHIISGDDYLMCKRDIIKLIKHFENEIEIVTKLKRDNNIKEGLRLYRAVLWFLLLVLLFAILAFYLIMRRIGQYVKQDILFKKGVEELKAAQKELLINNERFTLAVEGSNSHVWEYGVDDDKMIWSPQNLQVLGYEPSEILNHPQFILNKMHSDDKAQFITQLNRQIAEGTPLHMDARIYNKKGELRWCRCMAHNNLNTSNNKKRIIGLLVDISDRVIAEERATNAILETEDKERSRIAREIHDSLQQTMSTALLNFEKVRTNINITDKLLSEKYQVGYQYLKQAIKDSRTLAHNLMPKLVDKNGVAPAIESLVGALKGSTKIKLVFYHNFGETRFPLAIEMTIYRIVQEAINNAIKYSNAEECTIQLIYRDKQMTLTIEDDGIGFDKSKTDNTFGLNSMKTRAQAIGAFFQVESSPNRGTQLLFELTLTN